jgi:hypothetical protein
MNAGEPGLSPNFAKAKMLARFASADVGMET